MASYDLHCQECGHNFEVFVQGFLKDGDRVCPSCSSRHVEQRLTGGFLRGSSGASGGGSHSCGPTFG